MKLRSGTLEDIPSLVELGRQMHGESSFAPMDFDGEVFGATLLSLIETGQFLVVAENESGDVVGGMLGVAYQSWFGKNLMVNDMGLCLRPDVRGGMTAARLIHAFVAWGEEKGAKQIRAGVTTRYEGAERLYEGLGFDRVGAAFCKTLGERGHVR